MAIYFATRRRQKAITHYETALVIASPFDWHDEQSQIHYSLALLFSNQHRFDDAHAHVEHAKSHAVNNPYHLGRAMGLRARILYEECKFKEAQSEALCAADVFEKFGATQDLEDCRKLLHNIEAGVRGSATSGELMGTAMPPPTLADSPLSTWGIGYYLRCIRDRLKN